MSHIVTDANGVVHSFPDEATPEMMAQALGVSYSPNTEPEQQSSLIDKLPFMPKFALDAAISHAMNKNVPLSERRQRAQAALGRGFMNIPEGLKQAYLAGKEKIGMGEPGEYEDYTKKIEGERKSFEQTPAGRDPFNKYLTELSESTPWLLAGGPMGVETSLLKKMLMSGATGAAVGATKFVPQGGSRLLNTVVGGTANAAIPAIPSVAKGVMNATPYIEKAITAIPREFIQTIKDIPGSLKAGESKKVYEEAQNLLKNFTEQEKEAKTQARFAIPQAKMEASQAVKETKDIGNRNLFEARSQAAQEQLAARQEAFEQKSQANEQARQAELQATETEKNIQSEAQARKAAAEQKQAEVKTAAYLETGSNNPEVIQRKINTHQDQLDVLNDEINNFPEPSTHPISLEQNEANLGKAESTHEEAKRLEDSTHKDIGAHLNTGMDHDEDLTVQLLPKIKKIEDDAVNAYTAFTEKVKSTNAKMKPEAREDFQAELKEIRKSKNPYVQDFLDVAPNAADSNMTNFMTKYKDFGQALYNLSQTSKFAWENERINASMLKQINDAIKIGKQIKESAKKAINNGLGGLQEEFEAVNKGYSDYVYPIRGSKTIEKMRTEGKITSGDMTDALRGTAEDKVILRDLIKSDPTALKSIAGERFDSGINNLLTPNNRTKQYLDLMPDLNKMLENHQQAIRQVEYSGKNLKAAKSSHSENIKFHEEVEKSRQQKQEKISKAQEIEEEINTGKRNLDNLQSALKENPKGITAEEKGRIELAKKEARDSVDNARQIAENNARNLLKLKEKNASKLTQMEREHLAEAEKVTKKSWNDFNEIKDRHLSLLKEATNQKNLSLPEYIKRKQEYQKAQEASERMSKRLKLILGVTAFKYLKHLIF